MSSRRSVFPNQFVAGKIIPDEIIQQLLENANQAPTHKLTQPWRFRVFSGKGLEKLARFQSERYKLTAAEKFKQDKYEKLLRTPSLCSHVIAIGMKRNPIIPELEEISAVACAVENLWLSVIAYGLGGYWSTGGVTFDSEAKPFFDLDEEDKLMGFFYLGYVQLPSPKSSRTPIEEKLVWIRE
ncbi:MAG TPA: nitroreductase [Puia sp.]|nr:nitroreductase [Puia sp.]